VTGGCLCGEVRFELEPPIRGIVVCHCSLCRRSGTLAGAYTAVGRDSLRLTADATLAWYVDVNGRQRGFCRACGSTLFWSSEGDSAVSVSAGALDGRTGLTVERHIFVADAADWEPAPE
jgi:hypothetical protein